MSGITPTGELTVCMAHSGWAALKSHCQARWWAGTTWSTCGHPAGMWQGTSWGRQGKGQLRGSASSLTCGCTQQWDRRSHRDARWVCGPLAPVQTGCPHMRYWPLLSRRGWPCWSGCWRAGAYWWQPPPPTPIADVQTPCGPAMLNSFYSLVSSYLASWLPGSSCVCPFFISHPQTSTGDINQALLWGEHPWRWADAYMSFLLFGRAVPKTAQEKVTVADTPSAKFYFRREKGPTVSQSRWIPIFSSSYRTLENNGMKY